MLTNEEHHVALPKLYGAPAYARPNRPVDETPRPLDEDDLPLEAFRALDDGSGLDGGAPAGLNGGAPMGSNGGGAVADDEPRLEPRPFSLRSLSRFISGR
jgi:hypothetical protein